MTLFILKDILDVASNSFLISKILAKEYILKLEQMGAELYLIIKIF